MNEDVTPAAAGEPDELGDVPEPIEEAVRPDEQRRPVGGRRRRANTAGGRQHAHQVKVSAEESAQLLVLAHQQGVSVPRLLVEAALAGGAETPTQRGEVIVELLVIKRLLRNVANNVNQIAKVANATSEVDEDSAGETRAYTGAAQRLVARIDVVLDGLAR